MLILFDIDGTMLSSEGVGVSSINETVFRLHNIKCALQGIPVGGRLDPLIWDDICRKYNIQNSIEAHEKFRHNYTKVLNKNLSDVRVKVLPGVLRILEQLNNQPNVTLGVVTGNYKETGIAKIKASGLNYSMFTANAWGTDGGVRADLPPVAIAQSPSHKEVVLFGDTIHDVTSGQSAGCRVIAVCTGSHDRDTLEAAKPDLLLDDLSDIEAVLHWIHHTQTQ